MYAKRASRGDYTCKKKIEKYFYKWILSARQLIKILDGRTIRNYIYCLNCLNMIFFSKHLHDPKAGDLEFYFNQKNLGKISQYNVSVIDCRAGTYHFIMQESKKGWKIIYPPKLPGWIYNYEASLSEIIIENTMIHHNQLES